MSRDRRYRGAMNNYDLVDLSENAAVDPGTDMQPTALNDAGQAIGYFERNLDKQGFFYDPGTGLQRLADPLVPASGNVPAALNNLGDILGSATPGVPYVRWAGGGGTPVLTSLLPQLAAQGFQSAVVRDINDAGDIVGVSFDASRTEIGWLLSKDGTFTNLSALHSRIEDPRFINNNRRIAGTLGPDTAAHSFVYDVASDTLTDIDDGGGARYSIIAGLNEKGEVTGTTAVQGGGASQQHPFVYRDGIFTLLPQSGYAGALDDHTYVIGYQGAGGAALFDRNYSDATSWVNLNDFVTNPPGWYLARAVAINKGGQILCWGRRQSDAGAGRAFILKPTSIASTPMRKTPTELAFVNILFGILNDAAGIGYGGRVPYHVGSGPDDPPRREPFAGLRPAERDSLLGLALGQLGDLFTRSSDAHQVRALAARLVADAARRLNAGREPSDK